MAQGAMAMPVEARRTRAIGASTIGEHTRLLIEEDRHPRQQGTIAFHDGKQRERQGSCKAGHVRLGAMGRHFPDVSRCNGRVRDCQPALSDAGRLAATPGFTVRALSRWEAVQIGPPKIKVGKRVQFDLAKLPGWLACRESEPSFIIGRRC
jgi:hypothetical protein